MTRRMEAARTFLADFGVAHYCGYLWNQPSMRELLETLATGADSLQQTAMPGTVQGNR